MSLPRHLVVVAAKIVRAEEHFKSLDVTIRAYLDECRKAARFSAEINDAQRAMRIRQIVPEADLDISLMIGDCVHNARSSLDTLWKRLKRDGNFPMFSVANGEKGWKASRHKVLSGLPKAAHTIIDRLQPCSMGKDSRFHPLAVINKLSNIDKHETFHLTAAHSGATSFVFTDDDGSVVATIRPAIVFDEATQYVLKRIPDGLKPGMKMDVQGTMYIAFKNIGPWGSKPVQVVLSRCIKFIRSSVVAPLAPFTK